MNATEKISDHFLKEACDTIFLDNSCKNEQYLELDTVEELLEDNIRNYWEMPGKSK